MKLASTLRSLFSGNAHASTDKNQDVYDMIEKYQHTDPRFADELRALLSYHLHQECQR